MGELVDYNNPLVKYERELAARVGVRGRARALPWVVPVGVKTTKSP